MKRVDHWAFVLSIFMMFTSAYIIVFAYYNPKGLISADIILIAVLVWMFLISLKYIVGYFQEILKKGDRK